MDKVVEEKQLPIKMAAFGHCFRTEAGAGGTAGKGLYRVHQFSKVELFILCTPEQADALLEELIDVEVRARRPQSSLHGMHHAGHSNSSRAPVKGFYF